MHDYARPDTASLVENMLKAETIRRIEYLICSLDLNLIDHIWGMLGRRIAARLRPPFIARDLETAILEKWNSTPQSLM